MTGESLTISPAPLQGEVRVSGAKNSALRLMLASLLTEQPVVIRRFPAGLRDAEVQASLLRAAGKEVGLNTQNSECRILHNGDLNSSIDWNGSMIRNTVLMAGALVARTGEADVPFPGGCNLGERPIDLHLRLFREMGVAVSVTSKRLTLRRKGEHLRGCEMSTEIRSTGVTENALLMGVLATGRTRLHTPHLTPEVLDLISLLVSMGADIRVDEDGVLEINGVTTLSGSTWHVIPDRIEAITWIAGSLISGGRLIVRDVPTSSMSVALDFLHHAGGRIFRSDYRSDSHGTLLQDVFVEPSQLRSVEIVTGSHPAVHSDMQPLFGAMASFAPGRSVIVDLRYPERFRYLTEIARLGGRSSVISGRATIEGVATLTAGSVRAPDLRGGAALALCALRAAGPVEIHEAEQLFRGYDQFQQKLAALGVVVDHRLEGRV